MLTNIALTGGPLILFALFSLTVLVFAIIVALIIGLLVAIAFTVFAVGTALIVLFPTVFFTTLAATFLFLWGLGGYYILKKFNKPQGGGDNVVQTGAIGDKLNEFTGGKLGFIMGPAKESQQDGQFAEADGKKLEADSADRARKEVKAEKKQREEKKEKEEQHPTSNGTPKKAANTNGTPKAPTSTADVQKHVSNGANGVKKNLNADGVNNATNQVTKNAGPAGDAAKKVTKTANVDGVQNKLNGTTGTVKGTLGGATGLM